MLIDYALQYAARGWKVFPVHTTISGQCSCGKACGKDSGKHPKIKAWQKTATTDIAQIHRWWAKWPDANIGIATGDGLAVIDLDGPEEAARFAAITARYGGLPPCPVVRTGRGAHLYFKGDIGGSRKLDGILIRGSGGYVLAPPSWHASGRRYEWIKAAPLPELPEWFSEWAQSATGKAIYAVNDPLHLGALPAHLQALDRQTSSVTARADAALRTAWTALEDHRIRAALAAISADCERDQWLHIGMALHGLAWERADGSDRGFELWLDWSKTAKTKFQGEADLETRWASFGKPGREQVTLGTLYHYAQQAGWIAAPPAAEPPAAKEVMPSESKPPETQPHPVISPGGASNGQMNGHAIPLPEALTATANDSPLIDLNKKYCVIGDVGGKCLVMGYVPSKVDEGVQVPSFQTFKSFGERFGNRYVTTRRPKGDQWVEEPAQLGGAWLKWGARRSYEGLDMLPNGPEVLPNGYLNLWRGFSVSPKSGQWPLMRRHIATVLAASDIESIEYIIKWAAWKVQNPGERPEVALVFKGRKGAGKGTFARVLRQIFGPHGLQIFNSKHLVGSFNGHLRNCLLLYADEAFWAGDKQGESTLKGLITEPTIPIEQKGIDVVDWKNRIGLIMTTNAEWVVPASHDERRYAVFQVAEDVAQNETYFKALWRELDNGGAQAMLYDLQQIDLENWHPRRVPQTEALQQQKLRSLDPRFEWFEAFLSDGVLAGGQQDRTVASHWLYEQAKAAVPRLRDISVTGFGRFLGEMGCVKIHGVKGNGWRVPELQEARVKWEGRFGNWKWSYKGAEWVLR